MWKPLVTVDQTPDVLFWLRLGFFWPVCVFTSSPCAVESADTALTRLAGCQFHSQFCTHIERIWSHQVMLVMATIMVVSHSVIWIFTSQAELTVTFLWCVSAGPADGGKLDGLSGPYGAYAVSLWRLCVARRSLGRGRPPGETGTACWHWHGAKVQHATLRAPLSLLIPRSNTTPLDRTKRRGT